MLHPLPSPAVAKRFETLTTDRLVLRAATVDDAGVLFPITSDPHTPGATPPTAATGTSRRPVSG